MNSTTTSHSLPSLASRNLNGMTCGAVALALALVACIPDDELTADELTSDVAASVALPDLSVAPTVKSFLNANAPSARGVAVVRTVAAMNFYDCTASPDGSFAWAFFTPAAPLLPVDDAMPPGRLSAGFHYRSAAFPRLLTAAQLDALNIAPQNGVRPSVAVWDVGRADVAPKASVREIVAADGVAQDPAGAGNVSNLLLRVRGRVLTRNGVATDPASAPSDAIVNSAFVLRFASVGGVAPNASTCAAANAGERRAVAVSSDYYFIAQ